MYLSKFAELGTLSTNRAIYDAFIDLEFFESLNINSETVTVSMGFPVSNKPFMAS